jgi:catechol 2,3-dioxygenase-like lactoylglutathione lyase family enzyme
MNGAALHHVGCAVRDLTASLQHYKQLLGAPRRSPVFSVTSQGVEVCFVELGPNVYLELICGSAPGSVVDRYTKTGFYHLCFSVENIASMVETLGPQYRALPAFSSEAFGGRKCQFVVNPELHLIELVEIGVAEFAAQFAATASEL